MHTQEYPGSGLSTNDVQDGAALLRKFITELEESVESIEAIGDLYGSRTLADLLYLQSAIVNRSYIDHYPGESSVMTIVGSLPSAKTWQSFIKVENQ
ncbi:hypothetical protein [Flavobacterium sp.]|uniref:hypothetical protein n=1 Tax=Flavobacterium sp. TaxID=239 RepID=UPI002638E9FE|nr:hypothetical protein [Flavobacterium sp.]